MEATYQIIQICVGLATLVTLVVGLIKTFSAAKQAAGSADTAALEVAKVAEAVNTVIEQTNGMSHRLEQMADAAGERRGREEEIARRERDDP